MGGIPYLCSQMRLEYGNRMRMNNTRIMKWKFRLMCFKSIFLRLILESRLLGSGTALLRHNLEEDKFDFQINLTQNFLVSVRQRTEMSSSDRISDSYVAGHNSDEINNIFSSSDRISDLLVRKQRKVMIKVGSPFFCVLFILCISRHDNGIKWNDKAEITSIVTFHASIVCITIDENGQRRNMFLIMKLHTRKIHWERFVGRGTRPKGSTELRERLVPIDGRIKLERRKRKKGKVSYSNLFNPLNDIKY